MKPSDMAMLPISLGFFVIGFSLLSMSEFLRQEMETCETENHPLCGVSLYADTFLCISHKIFMYFHIFYA